MPSWLWRRVPDREALAALPEDKRYTGETSAKQVFDRLVGTWTYWGWKGGYFDAEEDARAYYDEMRFMLAAQMGAPNSPQWFNTGLHWAYGIDGPAQGHSFVDFETGKLVEDYIEGAGGLLGGARLEVAGVYLPSGELRPLDQSPWKYQPQNVPPGSIVVVPYRNESLQRYARDARAARMLPRVTATADGGGEDGEVASLLPPLAEATTQCPAP